MKIPALLPLFAALSSFAIADVASLRPVPADELSVVRFDSQEIVAEKAGAANAADGNPATNWITRWKDAQPGFPHEIEIALSAPRVIDGIELTPRKGGANCPDAFEVSVSADGKSWTPATTGNMSGKGGPERFAFGAPVKATRMKVVFRSSRDGKPYMALGEIAPLTAEKIPYKLDLAQGEHRKIENWLKLGGVAPDGTKLEVNSLYWSKNGKPWTPVMGEFHFYRYPAELWEQELRKMKAGGVSIVSTYVFWEAAEEPKGVWNWTGDNDIRRFVQLAQKAGLYVWLRPGPYVNGEIRHRGIPDWAWKLGARKDTPAYLDAVKVYFEQLSAQMKGLWFKDGGPIIGCQLENEYAHGSKDHIVSLKKIAEDAGFQIPYWSVTANSEYRYERGDILPLQGAYPYRYWCAPGPTTDYLYSTDEWGAMENLGRLYYDFEKFPRGMCELGGGCLNGYTYRFVVPAYDMEGSVQNVIGRGMNLPGYYMYHGGTHKPGMKDGAAGIPQNFDYQAPLGEFGQRRASYSTLKILHLFLNDFGDVIAPMQPARPAAMVRDPKDVSRLRYIGRFLGDSGFLFMTTCQPYVEHGPIPGVQITVKLPTGEVTVPAKPITLPKDVSPIFPVNLDLNGVTLRHSTAQLLAKVSDGGAPCFVFFAHDGIAPEFRFLPGTKIETATPVDPSAGFLDFRPAPSRDRAFALTAPDGRRASVLVISRKDAERAWRLDYQGAPRLLISDADLDPAAGGGLDLASFSPNMSLAVFPKPANAPAEARTATTDGAFAAYTFATPKVDIAVNGSPLPAKTWSMTVPKLPANVRDLLLRASYVGSTAELFADGKRYTDNRHIGVPFEFTTARFGLMGTRELKVVANPWDKKVKGIPQEWSPASAEEEKGMIRSVAVVPEYLIRVK